jgi:hypothetical protein
MNHLAIGDINGDGMTSLRGTNDANPGVPGAVTVLTANGSYGFTVGNVIPVNRGLGISLGDANGDTHLDTSEDSCAFAERRNFSVRLESFAGDIAARHAFRGPDASSHPIPRTVRVVIPLAHGWEGVIQFTIGRRIRCRRSLMAAGPHTVMLDRRVVRLAGIYFYRS